jgi:5-methylcytosine-specific restriction endonuclease McrA
MMSFRRPPEPEDFQRRVEKARAAIHAMVRRGDRPSSDDFVNCWTRFRDHFVAAQHGKCAYCERDVASVAYGDIEHVRPKAGLQELTADRARWGKETEGGGVEDRAPRKVSDWGYPWLAYEWANYVLACEKCNRAWKRNLFPVAEGPRLLPPGARPETPLLLNPFEGPDPVKHLAFDERGDISARDGSRHGEATIRTCGLHRERLRTRREDVARRVQLLLKNLESVAAVEAAAAGKDEPLEGDETDQLLGQIKELGDPRCEHAGMVRSMFEGFFQSDWRATFGEDPPPP